MASDNSELRMDRLARAMEVLQVNIESLYARVKELHSSTQEQGRNIAEQGRNIAEQGRNIDRLIINAERDAEAIRTLARIAESHQRRPTGLEGGPAAQ